MLEGSFKIKEIAEFLDVTEKTVTKWFKGNMVEFRGMKFVDFETFVDFITDYRDGLYMVNLCKKYGVNELTDENEAAYYMLRLIFGNLRLFINIDAIDDDEEDEVKTIVKERGLEATVVYM